MMGRFLLTRNKRKRNKKIIYLLSNNIYRIEEARQWGYSLPKGRFISFEWLPEHRSSAYRSLRCFGTGCRWSLPFGRLLFPSSWACLSSFRLAVRFARPQYRVSAASCRWLSRTMQLRGFRLCWFFFIIPVRSSIAWGYKKEESHQRVNCAILQFRKEVILSVCLLSYRWPWYGGKGKGCPRTIQHPNPHQNAVLQQISNK